MKQNRLNLTEAQCIRKMEAQKSLLKTPPDEQERLILHSLFLQTIAEKFVNQPECGTLELAALTHSAIAVCPSPIGGWRTTG